MRWISLLSWQKKNCVGLGSIGLLNSQLAQKKNKISVLKRKKVSLFRKKEKNMAWDPCSLLYALGVGLLLFAMLYFIRRLVNAFQRKDDETREKLGWEIDHMDRNFIRAALAASLLTLLICWFSNHDKETSYPQFNSADSFSGRLRAAGRDDGFPLDTPYLETPMSDVNMDNLVTGGTGDELMNALERLGNGNIAENFGDDVRAAIPLMSPPPNRINVITPEVDIY